MATRKKSEIAEQVPPSWDIEHWPANVYPHTPNRGRYVVRSNKTELLNEGALTRVGRDLVVIGAGYARFLAKRAKNVASYEIAPNRSGQAAT
jgi:hypothetical protein